MEKLIILCLLVTTACAQSNRWYYIPGDAYLHGSDFGLEPGDSVSTTFQALYDSAKVVSKVVVINEPGVYNFDALVEDQNANWDVEIIGVPGVVFTSKLPTVFRFWNSYTDVKNSLTYPISRGSQSVSGVSFGRGDVFIIEQEKYVGDTIGRGANVMQFGVDSFKKEFLFTTENADSVYRAWKYECHTFHMKNITMRNDSSFASPGVEFIQLRGYSRVTINNVDIEGASGQIQDGINMYACADIKVRGLDARNCRYPMVMNLCDNIDVRSGTTHDCRHYTTLSLWSRDSYISGITSDSSTRTPIEAHYAYNVHYNDITSTQTDQINLRAFGDLKITNSTITTDNTQGLTTIYSQLGYHFATTDLQGTEYEWLIDSTNIEFIDVSYTETVRGKFRGLTATSFKNMTVMRCTTTNGVGAYENAPADAVVTVDSSQFAFVYMRNGADTVTLRDCHIDCDDGDASYVHSVHDAGYINFIDCDFSNCTDKYLEEDWQAHGTFAGQNRFEGIVDTFYRLADTATTGALTNHKFVFVDSDVVFDNDYQTMYNLQLTNTLIDGTNYSLTWDDFTWPL